MQYENTRGGPPGPTLIVAREVFRRRGPASVARDLRNENWSYIVPGS